jgi:hypothetical protein
VALGRRSLTVVDATLPVVVVRPGVGQHAAALSPRLHEQDSSHEHRGPDKRGEGDKRASETLSPLGYGGGFLVLSTVPGIMVV